MKMTSLEEAAVMLLLAGRTPLLRLLRKQSLMATVSSRKRRSNSVRTYFRIPENAPRADHKQKEIDFIDVAADVVGTDMVIDFHLSVKDGLIRWIHSHAYADHWPEGPIEVSFWYMKEIPSGRGQFQRSKDRDWKYFQRMLCRQFS